MKEIINKKTLGIEIDTFLVRATRWAMNDDDRKAIVFEWLCSAVGSFAAISTDGNSKAINELMIGASEYQLEVAAQKAILVRELVK